MREWVVPGEVEIGHSILFLHINLYCHNFITSFKHSYPTAGRPSILRGVINIVNNH
jgi:hypothetical protein